jgi:hypothetical protein
MAASQAKDTTLFTLNKLLGTPEMGDGGPSESEADEAEAKLEPYAVMHADDTTAALAQDNRADVNVTASPASGGHAEQQSRPQRGTGRGLKQRSGRHDECQRRPAQGSGNDLEQRPERHDELAGTARGSGGGLDQASGGHDRRRETVQSSGRGLGEASGRCGDPAEALLGHAGSSDDLLRVQALVKSTALLRSQVICVLMALFNWYAM